MISFWEHTDWMHGILLVSGLVLFFRPLSAKYRDTSRLLRNTMFLAGFLAVVCGVSYLLAWLTEVHHFLNHNARAVVTEIHRISLGGSFSLLILLLSSSEFWGVEFPPRGPHTPSGGVSLSANASH